MEQALPSGHMSVDIKLPTGPRPFKAHMMTIMRVMPMMGSTALFLKHKVMPGDERTAYTNGREVFAGPAFFAYPQAEQNGILVHEYLHVILAHNHRCELMIRKLGDAYDHETANIAADIIVNGAIDRLPGGQNIKLPADALHWKESMETITAAANLHGLIYDLAITSLKTCRLEDLYDLIRQLQQACMKTVAADTDKNAEGSTDGDAQHEAKQNIESKEEKDKRQAAEKLLGLAPPIHDIERAIVSALSNGEINREIERAAQSIKHNSKLYGNIGGSLEDILEGDLPRSRTPWEKTFQQAVARHLSNERIKHRTRPGGGLLSQKAMGCRNRIWQPARHTPLQPHVVVIADSSGSVSDKAFTATLSEVDAMRRRTNAKVTLMVADTEVISVTEIKRLADVPKISFVGRGGTSFVQPLQRAVEEKADIIIYITDLMGEFPASCPVPVIWTIVPSHSSSKIEVPFGRVVEVEDVL